MRDYTRHRLAEQYKVETLGDGQASGARLGFGGPAGEKSLTGKPGGRPRSIDVRAVVNAIFYLLRTGCQWRLLPREFPPRPTVYYHFRCWEQESVWLTLLKIFLEPSAWLLSPLHP
jgi:hypothetical protein